MHPLSRTVLWTIGLFLYLTPYLLVCVMWWGSFREDPDIGFLEHTVYLTWHCFTDFLPALFRGLTEPRDAPFSIIMLTLILGWFLILSRVVTGAYDIYCEAMSKRRTL